MSKVIGYVIKRKGYGDTWLFAGTTAKDVARTLEEEVDLDIVEGFDLSERETFIIEPREFSQEELDNMPDFEGW